MIFDKIIKDLLQLNFFSEYKFRKRDSSFLLKTKGGKQFIEMDHWIDEATSSLVIYPIYSYWCGDSHSRHVRARKKQER